VRRFARYGAVVSLVLVDIDDFKAINDTYGHLEGDRILAAMGGSFIRLARDSDICCRYGGEEFAVILARTGPVVGDASEPARTFVTCWVVRRDRDAVLASGVHGRVAPLAQMDRCRTSF